MYQFQFAQRHYYLRTIFSAPFSLERVLVWIIYYLVILLRDDRVSDGVSLKQDVP